MINWSPFVQLVRSHSKFVLTCHIRPDCDALGSELALAGILEQLGKQVTVVNGFAIPPNYRFVDPRRRAKELRTDISLEAIEESEVLIVLDTTAWAQLGPMGEVVRNTRLKKVVIDHHVTADDLGATVFKDTDAEATGRLVIDAADQLGVPLNAEIATAAFLAVATDTGWFRFASTTAGTLHLASRLVAAGAAPHLIYKELYENERLARLRLMGRAMGRVQTEKDGRLIYTWLELSDFEACGALPSDSEDLINLTLSVSGTEAAVILVEQRSGGFKISFRSRSDLDCARIAEQFGGGGHTKAAGAFLPGPLDAARAKALDAVRAAMR